MFVSQEPTADSDSEGAAASDRRDKMQVRGSLFASAVLLLHDSSGRSSISTASGPRSLTPEGGQEETLSGTSLGRETAPQPLTLTPTPPLPLLIPR